MKILLDTSAYTGFKQGHKELVEYLIRAETILISPIVMGELLFGFRNGSKFDKNLKEMEQFLAQDTVGTIQIGDTTADRFSRIAAQLKQQGTPIPSNDIWIAAQALESGAELVTMDKHFEKIKLLVYRLFEN